MSNKTPLAHIDYQGHLQNARGYLEANRIENLLVKSSPNIFYLTGLLEIEGFFILSAQSAILLVPMLYYQEAADNLFVRGVEVIPYSEASLKKTFGSCRKPCFLETEFFSAAVKAFNSRYDIELQPAPDFLRELRAVKDKGEEKLIKRAGDINKEVFKAVESEFLAEPMTERELAGAIHMLIARHGGRKSAFDPIVASGLHSVYPHHKSRDTLIEQGKPLIVDIGVDFYGYKSDGTRTFFPGGPDREFQMLFGVLQETFRQSVDYAGEGKTGGDVHAFAASLLEKQELGGFFTHGLGHGVGIEVHEAPAISPNSKDLLQTGSVFTIEPGIYIPHKGGIRIEDTIILG